MSKSTPIPLAANFPPATHEAWLELVETTLKGAPFDKRLVHHTAEGLRVEPLYTADSTSDTAEPGLPGATPYVRGGRAAGTVTNGWEIRQRHDHPDLDLRNKAILDDLERGVSGLDVVLDDAITSVDDLDRVLDGVLIDLIPITLSGRADFESSAELLAALWQRRGVPASELSGSLGADPLGAFARQGALHITLDQAHELLGRRVAEMAASTPLPRVRAVTVDGSVYADAGASDAQELACAMATGISYLRAAEGAGVSIDDACAQIGLTLTAGADQFQTIAKLRAARRMWGRIAEASGAASGSLHLHVETASAMMTRRDPWVNMLRTTLACFAAAVGGADAITVRPFDDALGLPDDFGHRIARNTQLILLEESQLASVIDPAGGSWFVETMTEQLADEAWTRMQDIEGTGGMGAALSSGSVQQTIAATVETHRADVARRKRAITGVSEFPNIDEAPLARVPRPSRGSSTHDAAVTCEPLVAFRPSEPFEALRDLATEAASAPSVFLANLGPIPTHSARATYATNVFEAGGIRALQNDGFEATDEVVAAFAASDARLACICSSDSRYAEQAAEVAQALVTAGAAHVYLAGNPGDQREALGAAGVTDFVYIGADILTVLQNAHAAIT